jgi:hypothetical protein
MIGGCCSWHHGGWCEKAWTGSYGQPCIDWNVCLLYGNHQLLRSGGRAWRFDVVCFRRGREPACRVGEEARTRFSPNAVE